MIQGPSTEFAKQLLYAQVAKVVYEVGPEMQDIIACEARSFFCDYNVCAAECGFYSTTQSTRT